MRKDQSKEEIAIRVELAKRQMSVEELAKTLGVSRGYMYDILHGYRKAYKFKEKIYAYLGLKFEN